MDSAAVRCSDCGKLRKDIYNNKILSYIFCIPAGLLIGFSFIFMKSHNRNEDFYNYYNSGNSSGDSTGTILLVIGIVLGLAGTYFYVKASQQMKSWWWV